METREQRRVDAMLDALDGVVTVSAEIGTGDWGRPTGCPGWTVQDVLAHVVGLEDVMTGGPEPDVELPDGLAHVTNDVSRYTERHVHVRRGMAPSDLVDELHAVVARRREQLEGDLHADAPGFLGRRGPLIDVLPLRAFDIYCHEQDIRRAIGRPGHLSGPAADNGLFRSLRGLAAALPDRVVADEATLVVVVEGEESGTLWLDLGTGEILDEAPASPTVTLVFPFADLIALAGGRHDAPDPATVVTVTGNDALAARVLTSLAITP